MGFNIQHWFEEMNKGEILFSCKEDITSDLISKALEVIETKLFHNSEKTNIRRRIYSVTVECLQNLYHHGIDEVSDKIKTNQKYGMFIISKNDSTYKISTGNFLSVKKIKLLKDRLDQINSLSKDELKYLYKLILNNDQFTEKGGGGLGMIYIAKRTGNKLEYMFHSYNNEYSFFCLNIKIS